MEVDKMNSTIKFRKAEQMFVDLPVWQNVHERDRRELYEDVLHQLAKKEKVIWNKVVCMNAIFVSHLEFSDYCFIFCHLTGEQLLHTDIYKNKKWDIIILSKNVSQQLYPLFLKTC